MSLLLPGNIPVAAISLAVLEAKGECKPIPGYDMRDALVQFADDPVDSILIWASPYLRGYRSVWRAAHQRYPAVDALDSWGEGIDVDHVYPKSWAKVPGMEMAYVRLFPVYLEVNRSAGAGREKAHLDELRIHPLPINDIMYANELQVLKIIGHPVGSSTRPESIFTDQG